MGVEWKIFSNREHRTGKWEGGIHVFHKDPVK